MSDSRVDGRGAVVACPSCGQRNRMTYTALGKSIRCATCKTMLEAPGAPIEVSDSAAFRAAVADSALPVVVDFWAPWCGPCRMVAPEIERLARDARGRYLVLKVNTDALTDVAAEFRIRSIPTVAVLFRGRELARAAGARSAGEIRTFADDAIANSERRAS